MKRKFNLIIGLILITNVSYSQINLQNGLIAHFPFNGNAADSSGNNNNGQVNGPTLTIDRHGNANSAYLFDGIDDIINIPNYSNMSPTDAVTIAAWIKTSSAIGSPIIYDRLGTNDGFGLRLNSNGNLRLAINGGVQDVISSSVVNDGQWHYVIGSYDKNLGELKVYIDGIEEGSSNYFSSITYTPEPRNSIGAPGGVNPVFFDGSIDGLRVYNRALNSCEIQTLAEKQFNFQNGLIAHFPFNGNAADSSGNNNNGQVNGPTLTMDRHGNANSAYLFDGIDDIIDIPNYSNMSPTDAVTVAAWIKTSSAIGSPIIYDRLGTNDGFGLRLNSNGNLRLAINGGVQDVISSSVVNDGQWHYVIGSYDKNLGELKVYIDGIEEGSSNYFSSITYTPEPRNSIGAPGGVNPVFFDGAIDGLRVYNRALNLCEIQTLISLDSTNQVTSIQNVAENATSINLFPNPTKDFLVVDISNSSFDQTLITIIDIQGRLVFKKNFGQEKNLQIDVNNFVEGMYFLQIKSKDKVESARFIKID